MISKRLWTDSRAPTTSDSRNRSFSFSRSVHLCDSNRLYSDAAEIKSYPRNIPSLVRREDTTRKDARERRKTRKEEELQKKKEEVRRLKSLKMKEIRAKLDRIGREGGKDFEADPGTFPI